MWWGGLPYCGVSWEVSSGGGGRPLLLPRAVWGGLKRSGGDVASAPGSKGRPLWGGSMLGYVNGSRGPVGGAPLGAR